MKRKIALAYISIVLLFIYFLFSVLEIYNISALYKDVVEFPAMMLPEKITNDYTLDLVKQAASLTSTINFFQYSAITAPVLILVLFSYIRRLTDAV